jgi:hypothetical protein
MKRLTYAIGIALLAAVSLTLLGSFASAGRFGGPASEYGVAPAYQSVYYDVPFNTGEPAVVTIVGSGTTILDLRMYDGDGNMAIGVGFGDRKMVAMDVYRTGGFRVEVRNLGPVPNTFFISTN